MTHTKPVFKAKSPLMPMAIGLLTAGLLIGCGSDNPEPEPESTDTEPRSAQVRADSTTEPGERLIAVPPLNWELRVQSLNPELRILEYGPPSPEGTDPENPPPTTERIIFETYTADPLPEPMDVLHTMALRLEERCQDLEAFNTFIGEENNYPTAVALLICYGHHGSGDTRVHMAKGIKGNDEFFLVMREQRLPSASGNGDESVRPDVDAMSEVVGALALYLRSVSLCDDRYEAHPCRRSPLDL
jgi:hypothetical protein